MPPKSNSKKNQASWFHCETCGAHIPSKARDNHEEICPTLSQGEIDPNSTAEFLRSGVLYTTSVQQRNFEVDSLKDLPLKYTNMIIFLSEGAMQLAQLHIGQHVVIQALATEEPPLVRIVWPISEQFLSTIFVNDAGKIYL